MSFEYNTHLSRETRPNFLVKLGLGSDVNSEWDTRAVNRIKDIAPERWKELAACIEPPEKKEFLREFYTNKQYNAYREKGIKPRKLGDTPMTFALRVAWQGSEQTRVICSEFNTFNVPDDCPPIYPWQKRETRFGPDPFYAPFPTSWSLAPECLKGAVQGHINKIRLIALHHVFEELIVWKELNTANQLFWFWPQGVNALKGPARRRLQRAGKHPPKRRSNGVLPCVDLRSIPHGAGIKLPHNDGEEFFTSAAVEEYCLRYENNPLHATKALFTALTPDYLAANPLREQAKPAIEGGELEIVPSKRPRGFGSHEHTPYDPSKGPLTPLDGCYYFYDKWAREANERLNQRYKR